MEASTAPARVLRFGIFELDAHSRELRRHGLKVRLPRSGVSGSAALAGRPGEVVTREELRQHLWTSDTFVDFDLGLNSAVRKLREALDDSADNPRFVETLPRRGYRFIAPLQPATPERIVEPAAGGTTTADAGGRLKWIAGGLVLAVMIATPLLYQRGWWGVRADAGKAGAGSPAEGEPRAAREIDPAAHAAYLKGMTAGGGQTYEAIRNAVGYFEIAVARQPDFATAYASLGQAQLQFLYVGPLSPRETVPKAEAATRKALQLDDTLAQAHQTLAMILRNYHWRWKDAEKEALRARALRKGPSEPPTTELIQNGQFALAIAQAERVRRSDPLSFAAAVNLAGALRAAKQSQSRDRGISKCPPDQPAHAAQRSFSSASPTSSWVVLRRQSASSKPPSGCRRATHASRPTWRMPARRRAGRSTPAES